MMPPQLCAKGRTSGDTTHGKWPISWREASSTVGFGWIWGTNIDVKTHHGSGSFSKWHTIGFHCFPTSTPAWRSAAAGLWPRRKGAKKSLCELGETIYNIKFSV